MCLAVSPGRVAPIEGNEVIDRVWFGARIGGSEDVDDGDGVVGR